jgi:adenine-specific DNA-methyltransferase
MKNSELCFRSFNYIGSKMKLLDFIESNINEYTGKKMDEIESFADIFSGTGVVAYHSLKRGCKKILTNDIQNYAYVVSSVWTTKNINIEKVKEILNEINDENEKLDITKIIATERDFIYNNYTEASDVGRMYLTRLNGYKVDKTRQKLDSLLDEKLINKYEFNLMLKILLYAVTGISNIASVYGAYLKNYKPCSLKNLNLDVSLINSMIKSNSIEHNSYNMNVTDLLDERSLSDYEVVYIDPPYVANRSYHDNYHLLETISKYDYPNIKGKTGLRDEITTKSKFCSKRDALEEFKSILGKIKSKYIFISYSSESIVSKAKMIEILGENWDDVTCYERNYQRFKSNKNSDEKQAKNVVEYLFCGKKRNNN